MCLPLASPTLWSSPIAAEVKQMQQHTDHHTTKGSPELAMLFYALMALLAYLVIHAV
jgi:hypothetical protein